MREPPLFAPEKRMSRKPPATAADYMIVAINPALIMLLVGSVLFFLCEVFYRGQYEGRLAFICAMYVMGIVAVSRISMEEGTGYAAGFGAPLAIVVYIAFFKFVEFHGPMAALSPLLNAVFLAFTWWLAYKLTWDCTLLDDKADASGQGLLEAAGFDAAANTQANGGAPQANNASVPVPAPEQRPSGPLNAAEKLLAEKEKYERQRLEEPSFIEKWFEADRKPRAQGVWVLWFAAIALPIFGVMQWFVPASDSASRVWCLQMLLVYVGSSLALLLNTSFLSLRRYLRQRKLEMPLEMAGVWMIVGAALIGGVMLFCLLLPRPGAEVAISQPPITFGNSGLNPSRWGMGNDGKKQPGGSGQSQQAQKQDPQPGSQSGQQNSGQNASQSSNSPGSQSSSSQSPGTQSSGSQPSGSRPSDSQSSGSKSQGSPGQGGQSQASQSQASQSQASQPQSSQSQGSQSQGSQSQSSQSQASQPSPSGSPPQNQSSQQNANSSSSGSKSGQSPSQNQQSSSGPQNSGPQNSAQQSSGQSNSGQSPNKSPSPTGQQQTPNSNASPSNSSPSNSSQPNSTPPNSSPPNPSQQSSSQQNPSPQNSSTSSGAKSPESGSQAPKSPNNDQAPEKTPSNQTNNSPQTNQSSDPAKNDPAAKTNPEQKSDPAKSNQSNNSGSGSSPSSASQPPQSNPQSSSGPSSPPPAPPRQSNFRLPSVQIPPGLGNLLKLLLWAAIAVAIVVGLIRYREQLAAAWKQLLDELARLWARLFGAGVDESAAAEAATTKAVTPPRPFASYPNPFTSGLAARMPSPQLMGHTLAAAEAFGRERGFPRDESETPHEYLTRLFQQSPEVVQLALAFAETYGQVAFGKGAPPQQAHATSKRLWQVMSTTPPPPPPAAAGPQLQTSHR